MSSRPQIPRTTAIITSSVLAVIAAVLLVIFIVHLSQQKGGRVQIGELEFKIPVKVTRLVNDAGKAPLFFPDARAQTLDIYVSHVGSDVRQGWQAFEARQPAQARNCDVQWQPGTHGGPGSFRDPCTAATYPENGAGLLHFPVRIDSSDHLIVDFQHDVGTSPLAVSTTAAP